MPEPVNTVQNQPNPNAQVSVTQRPEGAPIGVSAEAQIGNVSEFVQSSGEFAEPQVDNQVTNFVQVKRDDRPLVDKHAEEAGVTDPMAGPNYNPRMFKSIDEAKEAANKGQATEANTWSAAEYVKNALKSLLNLGKEPKPAH